MFPRVNLKKVRVSSHKVISGKRIRESRKNIVFPSFESEIAIRSEQFPLEACIQQKNIYILF